MKGMNANNEYRDKSPRPLGIVLNVSKLAGTRSSKNPMAVMPMMPPIINRLSILVFDPNANFSETRSNSRFSSI
jgi:hypothetical protein